MAAQLTAPGRRLAEHRKARARVPLLILIALLCPPLAGIHSAPIWLTYLLFSLFYSLWVLRLCAQFGHDRRLGYLLCLTDFAMLLPLFVWSNSTAVQVILAAVWVAGLTVTALGAHGGQRAARPDALRTSLKGSPETRRPDARRGAPLERAVQLRLSVFQATGSRFALVVLRTLRFEENSSYYGEESSRRMLAAVSRRGLRLLGPDAQHFVLPGGRIAFLFEIEPAGSGLIVGPGGIGRPDPTDIESLAMTVGRKACEHLVDGRRVECVVGWASAPSDGLTADDLMYVAEAGAQSTAAFRRVAEQVTVPERARAATG